MQYAKVNDNTVIEMGTIQELFPNISFPISGADTEFIKNNNLCEIKYFEEIDTNTKKIISVDPYIKDNTVYMYTVTEKTPDDYNIDLYTRATDVRTTRNKLLKDTDWTQMPDSPIEKTKWVKYRQDLRDITLQSGFPFDILWPTAPQ